VVLAQPQQVHAGLGGLRHDAQGMHAQVFDLTEVDDDRFPHLRESAAQLDRLGEVERAAQPDQRRIAELLPHHLEMWHPPKVTMRSEADNGMLRSENRSSCGGLHVIAVTRQ
jgi:hypothetical protein